MTHSATFPGATLESFGRRGDGTGWAIFVCDLELGRRVQLTCDKLGWFTPYHAGICRSRTTRSANMGEGELTFRVVTEQVIEGKANTQETDFVTEFSKINRFRWVPRGSGLSLRCIAEFSRRNLDVGENFEALALRYPNARGSLRLKYEPLVDRSRIAWKYRVPLTMEVSA